MNKIWANRLIAGTQVWDSVPDYRRNGVKTELASRVEDGEITAVDPLEQDAQETQAPEETEAPVVTAEPTVTEAPAETEAPQATPETVG